MMNIALVGYGAIGHGVLQLLRDDATIHVDQVIATERSLASARAGVAALFPSARVAMQLASQRRFRQFRTGVAWQAPGGEPQNLGADGVQSGVPLPPYS